MKRNEKLLTVLNLLLVNELTAINQYMVQSEMCGNLGYGKLHKVMLKQALDEMLQAEQLIERILFLDDSPTLSKLNTLMIGNTVTEMISSKNGIGHEGVSAYNNAITMAHENNDQDTADLLGKMLKMKESHVDWSEMQRMHIEHWGMEDYLFTQTEILAN